MFVTDSASFSMMWLKSEAAEFNVNRMSWRIRAARDYSTTNNDDEAPARGCSHFS
jgi:hypothetical protein